MEKETFEFLAGKILGKSAKLLFEKSKEYAKGKDALSNFKDAAAFLKTTPEKALLGFTSKHIISLRDLIEDAANGAEIDLDTFCEKCIDIINYMIILLCIRQEKKCEEENGICTCKKKN